MIVAGGFPGYGSEKAESAAMGANSWEPGTRDFIAAGEGVQAGKHCSRFFRLSEAQPGTIRRVVFIGHGNPSVLGLSGGLNEMGAMHFSETIDTKSSLRKPRSNPADRCEAGPDVTIHLVCCNTAGHMGASQSFLKKMANSFGRCIRGFKGSVFWDYPINDQTKELEEANRGRTSTSQDRKPSKRAITIWPMTRPFARIRRPSQRHDADNQAMERIAICCTPVDARKASCQAMDGTGRLGHALQAGGQSSCPKSPSTRPSCLVTPT